VSPKIFTSLLKIRSDLYKSLDSERMILRLTQALWLASFRRLGLLAGMAEAARGYIRPRATAGAGDTSAVEYEPSRELRT
jgi:hypothetical protein